MRCRWCNNEIERLIVAGVGVAWFHKETRVMQCGGVGTSVLYAEPPAIPQMKHLMKLLEVEQWYGGRRHYLFRCVDCGKTYRLSKWVFWTTAELDYPIESVGLCPFRRNPV